KDTTTSSIAGTSNPIAVIAAAVTHIILQAPSSTIAGTLIGIKVTAEDAFNNVATGYKGTVHFTSTDGQAVLPGNSGLTNGIGNLNAPLKTPGTKPTPATDTVNSSLTAHAVVAVSPGLTAKFKVTGPVSTVAGNAFNITVAAEDAFNNATPAFQDS